MRNHLIIVGVLVVLISSTLGGVVGGKVLSNDLRETRKRLNL